MADLIDDPLYRDPRLQLQKRTNARADPERGNTPDWFPAH